jgi:hypothetical protein
VCLFFIFIFFDKERRTLGIRFFFVHLCISQNNPFCGTFYNNNSNSPERTIRSIWIASLVSNWSRQESFNTAAVRTKYSVKHQSVLMFSAARIPQPLPFSTLPDDFNPVWRLHTCKSNYSLLSRPSYTIPKEIRTILRH